MTSVRLLIVCGSLQARSANRSALEVAERAAIAGGATVDTFQRLADLPAFDPDLSPDDIEPVVDWRQRVTSADAVVVAAPEYAGAIAGAVKNAFDWLVGTGELYRKPVAVISAGTSGGGHARRMLAQTLTWQGAYVVAELGIASPRPKSDADGRLVDGPTCAAIGDLVATLLGAPSRSSADVVGLARATVGLLGVDVAHVAPAADQTFVSSAGTSGSGGAPSPLLGSSSSQPNA